MHTVFMADSTAPLASLGVIRPDNSERHIEITPRLKMHIDGAPLAGVHAVSALCTAVFILNADRIFDRSYFDSQLDELKQQDGVDEALRYADIQSLGMSAVSAGIRDILNARRRWVKPHMLIFGKGQPEFFFCSNMTDSEHGLTIVAEHVKRYPKKETYLASFQRKFNAEQRHIKSRSIRLTPEVVPPKVVKEPVKKPKKKADSNPGEAEPKRMATPDDQQAFYDYLVGAVEDASTSLTDTDIEKWIIERGVAGIRVQLMIRMAIERGYISLKTVTSSKTNAGKSILYERKQ